MANPSAATMSAMHACIMRAVRHIHDPAAVLSVANEFAFNYNEGVIVTALVAFLNRRLHTMTFANAGHPPPLLLSSDCHAFLEHPPADLPLGIYSQYSAASYVVALPLDAFIVFYTDGITEHRAEPVRGERELAEAARLVYDRPASDDARAIARERSFARVPAMMMPPSWSCAQRSKHVERTWLSGPFPGFHDTGPRWSAIK